MEQGRPHRRQPRTGQVGQVMARTVVLQNLDEMSYPMDKNLPETDLQFVARMLVATREGDQLNGAEARKLNDLAQFGRTNMHQETTTMPEERRDPNKSPGGGIGHVAAGETYPPLR